MVMGQQLTLKPITENKSKNRSEETAEKIKAFKGTVYFGLGYACNNRCGFCVIDAAELKKKVSDLSASEIIEFLSLLKNTGEVTVELSGGEPTVRQDFFYITEFLHKNKPDINTVLFSNARLFSGMSFCGKFFENPTKYVLIPILADTEELHDALTASKGSFKETVLGIKNLLALGACCGIKTIVNKMNYGRLSEIADFVAREFPQNRRINFDMIDISGSALRNKDLAVQFSEITPHLEKAVARCLELGLVPGTLFFPPCVINEKYRRFAGCVDFKNPTTLVKEGRSEVFESKPGRGTIEKCAGCRLIKSCQGTWFSYFNFFGSDEIKKIA